ncbi:MAG: hypothetical protein IPK69_05365 [Phycisphaerales bacterium]|nr:MAG: hypothetical protein IPK69_05365 [Phycisphaerales bacterium]
MRGRHGTRAGWGVSLVVALWSVMIGAGRVQGDPGSVWTPSAAFEDRGALDMPRSRPVRYGAFLLDLDGMRAQLGCDANGRGRSHAGNTNARIWLPDPDGVMHEFEVDEVSIFEPALSAKWSSCRTFAGRGVDEAWLTVRCEMTPDGFGAQVLGDARAWSIDPWNVGVSGGDARCAVYRHGDARAFVMQGWVCETQDDGPAIESRSGTPRIGTQLRTYRLAIAATGEYTALRGGVAGVQSAITSLVNRLNGMYEIEAAISFTLVANNDLLIYTDSVTDPYTNSDNSTMLGENQVNVPLVIGNGNFDLGHVFGTANGGIATIGVTCSSFNKARGVSASPFSVTDSYTVQTFCHEVGHQLGARHTFNGTNNSCSAANYSASGAYEPGSGSTVMSYSSFCGVDNIAGGNVGELYLNQGSFDLIASRADGSGSCAADTATGNTPPTLDAGAGYTIPSRTPFTLTATGSDVDGDSVTYCWEQRDLGPQQSLTAGDTGSGPIIRSRTPTAVPTRTIPRLAELLANTTAAGEILPTTTRSLHFRVTARDNRVGGGGVTTDDLTLNVVGTAGPFRVSSPNTNVSWTGAQTVTWDVAGTDANGINTASVRILLSTDGGLTFPTILVSSTANDGSEAVVIPDTPTSQARIRVEAIGNIYFDVSDSNFTIPCSAPATVAASDSVFCDRVEVTWAASAGAISYQVWRATVNNSGSAALIGTSSTTTYQDATGTVSTPYYYFIKTVTGGCVSAFSASDVGTKSPLVGVPTNVTASDGAFCDRVTVSWDPFPGATEYRVQRGAGDSIIGSANLGFFSGTSFEDTTANPGQTYYYFVRATTSCGVTSYAPSETGFRGAAPESVSGVAATGDCDGVVVGWTTNATATTYEVFRDADGVFASAVSLGSVAEPSFDDETAAAGTSYTYWVVASNTCGAGGVGSPGVGARLTPPAAPTGLAASQATLCGQVDLAWDAEVSATGYEVLRSTTNDELTATVVGTPTSASLIDSGVTPGTTYFYWVRAISACGTGALSASSSGSSAAPVSITSEPVAISICPGEDATFTVVATGQGPLSYQWYRDEAPVGSDQASFPMVGVQAADDGAMIRCDVTNLCGTVSSSSVTLEVGLCPTRLYADASALAGGDGLSWATAFQNVQDALTLSTTELTVSEIWIAEGMYLPTTGVDRSASFSPRGGLALYGGFPAGGAGNLAEADPASHPTRLSGDLLLDDGTVGTSDNSYHVVLGPTMGKVSLVGLTIEGGNADGIAPDDAGGGVVVRGGGTLEIRESIVRGNSALTLGGGVMVVSEGELVVTRSTLVANTAGQGGGVGLLGLPGLNANASILSSTLSGNSAGSSGGAIAGIADCTLTVVASTIAANDGLVDAGGVVWAGGPCVIQGTIVWGNTSPLVQDFSGLITMSGHNLIGDVSGVAGLVVTDVVGVDANLGVLTGNGGPTPTHVPAFGSPAIDAGDPAGCGLIDQRGQARPQDGDGFLGARCDIGAVEAPMHCLADFDDGTGTGNPDGGVTIDDLLYYVSLFDVGDTRADVDDGSGTGTRDLGVTIDDLLYYLARFNTGC